MNNYLESQINKLLNFINENEIGFGWKNHPNRLYNGSFVQGEPFDYSIMTKYSKMCFDAKETDKTVWNITKKDLIQAKNLYSVGLSGIESFFLIYFINSNELMKISIKKFYNILEERKHIKQNDCIPFDFKELIEPKETKKRMRKQTNKEEITDANSND
jgi:penicillin-binding protein-related factor A (putative recombinase)